MSFYKQIAPYYHHIFKINAPQVEFVKSKIPTKEASIIDVGCGIGTLSFELDNYYKSVFGLDMDAEMINSALKDSRNNSKHIKFKELSMLELTTSFNKNTIDGIICFGNTLVHLNSLNDVASFIQQAKTILKPNGKLLLQIVNYNRILEKNIQQLPIIDNNHIQFKRSYNFKKETNKIDFKTELTVKTSSQIIENSIELLPILKNELAELLKSEGFKNYSFYGNFKQEPFTINSPALIVEAVK